MGNFRLGGQTLGAGDAVLGPIPANKHLSGGFSAINAALPCLVSMDRSRLPASILCRGTEAEASLS